MIKKIVELEIDENILTGTTGVDFVAWVESPAIDTEFMYFKKEEDYGVELEDLLNQGWEIKEVNSVDPYEIFKKVKEKYSKVSEQKFYQIMTDPDENSIMDFAGTKIRYVYVSGMGTDLIKTSRDFCKRMMGGKQYVFRYENIMRLNAQLQSEDTDRIIIPRPVGSNVDIMTYKGGANCCHYWLELVFGNSEIGKGYDEPITNRKRDEIRKAVITTPSPGQSGQVNPKANPQKRARDGFAKEIFVPKGYIQGLPVFEHEIDAAVYSYINGCEGEIEEVEYLGKPMFQACKYIDKEEDFNRIQFAKDEEKRMVYGPLMVANVLIPRMDEDTKEKYYAKFKPETIEKIQRKFMVEGYQRNTNLEHDENIQFKDAVLVENWIVTSDNDKIYSMGFNQLQIPIGSWVGGYYILPTPEGDKLWKLIKNGKVRGFSVEGFFNLKFNKVTEDDILIQQIIDIIKNHELS